jgi:hypothetical protein
VIQLNNAEKLKGVGVGILRGKNSGIFDLACEEKRGFCLTTPIYISILSKDNRYLGVTQQLLRVLRKLNTFNNGKGERSTIQ